MIYLCRNKETKEWFAKETKPLPDGRVKVTTVPLTPWQAVMLKQLIDKQETVEQ